MTWSSPYQSETLHQALSDEGLPSRILETPSGPLFANRFTGEWWVHELAEAPPGALPLPGTVFRGFAEYDATRWSDGAYFTPVVTEWDTSLGDYSASTRRNIRRALERGCRVESATPSPDEWTSVGQGLERLFAPHANHLPLTADRMLRWVRRGVTAGCVTLFRTYLSSGKLIAAGIVLHSSTVANLRFSAFDPDHGAERPVNLLFHAVIGHFLSGGRRCVDLSGVVGPRGDQALQGVDRFKLGYTRTIARFDHVEADG